MYNTEKCEKSEIRFTSKITRFQWDFQILIVRTAKFKSSSVLQAKIELFYARNGRKMDFVFRALCEVVCGLMYFCFLIECYGISNSNMINKMVVIEPYLLTIQIRFAYRGSKHSRISPGASRHSITTILLIIFARILQFFNFTTFTQFEDIFNNKFNPSY